MVLRPFLYSATSCASYLFGCMSHGKLAVVDPHVELVDDYVATAAALGSPITAVFETHVQADHVSGLPALVERGGATAYLPAGTGVDSDHRGACRWRHRQARKHRGHHEKPRLGTRRRTTPTGSPTGAAGRTSRGLFSPATRF